MSIQGLTRQAQLQDLLNVTVRNSTCSKIENITVGNTAVKLNPPSNCFYVVIQVSVNDSAADATQIIRISECSTTPATTTLGVILGFLDIYDLSGSNNINGFSMCAIDNKSHTVTAQYYTL